MLKLDTVNKIIEKYNKNKEEIDKKIGLQCNKKTEKVPNSVLYSSNLVLSIIPEILRAFLMLKKFSIKYLSIDDFKSQKIKDNIEEIPCFAFSNLDSYRVFLLIPTKDEVSLTISNLLHEIGHFAILYLIIQSYIKSEVKEGLENFIKFSIEEGGLTDFSNKYIKDIYGKKTRELKNNIIYGLDIKIHENFAEGFRVLYEMKLDNKYGKEVKIEDYFPTNRNKSLEIFLELEKRLYG